MPTEIMIDTGASVDIIDEHALLRVQKYSRKTNQPPITLLLLLLLLLLLQHLYTR